MNPICNLLGELEDRLCDPWGLYLQGVLNFLNGWLAIEILPKFNGRNGAEDA